MYFVRFFHSVGSDTVMMVVVVAVWNCSFIYILFLFLYEHEIKFGEQLKVDGNNSPCVWSHITIYQFGFDFFVEYMWLHRLVDWLADQICFLHTSHLVFCKSHIAFVTQTLNDSKIERINRLDSLYSRENSIVVCLECESLGAFKMMH